MKECFEYMYDLEDLVLDLSGNEFDKIDTVPETLLEIESL